jgi:hypothetical protein
LRNERHILCHLCWAQVEKYGWLVRQIGPFSGHIEVPGIDLLNLVISNCGALHVRLLEDGTYVPCWQNERIDNNQSPVWPPVRIPLSVLCNGDYDRPLRIDIWDHEKSGNHQYMGVVGTTARTMLEHQGIHMDVIEPDKQAKSKSYTNSGTFTVTNCHIESYPTLTEVCNSISSP